MWVMISLGGEGRGEDGLLFSARNEPHPINPVHGRKPWPSGANSSSAPVNNIFQFSVAISQGLVKELSMTPSRQTLNVTGNSGNADAVHLLLKEDDVKMMGENPGQFMEEMRLRATEMGSVLEGILLEPQGHSDWGLNE
jgi:hypothetical protein